MTTSHRVATSEQAALLLDVQLRPLLTLLMRGEHSASQVAARLDLTLQRAHYLLGRLERAGVAEVGRLQPRAGRAVRFYAVSPCWFVPFEVTGAETLEQFMAAQVMPRMERFVGLCIRQLEQGYRDWGYWLEAGNMNMGDPANTARTLFEDDRPFTLNIGTMHLSAEHASELKRRLLGLLREFEPHEDARQPAYTIGLLLAKGEVG